MQSDSDLKIRAELARYLNHEIELDVLEDFLVRRGFDASWSSGAGSVISRALLLVAEHGNGHWTDDRLREELRAVLYSYPQETLLKQITGTSNSVIPDRVAYRQVAAAGKGLEAASL